MSLSLSLSLSVSKTRHALSLCHSITHTQMILVSCCGTDDGNIIAAIAQDPQLLRFSKIGTIIPNPTNPKLPLQNNATDTPTPGQLPRYSFRCGSHISFAQRYTQWNMAAF